MCLYALMKDIATRMALNPEIHLLAYYVGRKAPGHPKNLPRHLLYGSGMINTQHLRKHTVNK